MSPKAPREGRSTGSSALAPLSLRAAPGKSVGRNEEESLRTFGAARIWDFWGVASLTHQLLIPQHMWPCRRTGKREFQGTEELPTQVGLWERKYHCLAFPKSLAVLGVILNSTQASSRCKERPAQYFSNRGIRENMCVGLHRQHCCLLREGQHAHAQTGAPVPYLCPFLLPGGHEVTRPFG